MYIIEPMVVAVASQIAKWKYPQPYDFYNLNISEADNELGELMNGTYYQISGSTGDIWGFCCFGESAQVPAGTRYGGYPDDGALDIGLGMRPEMTGQGAGYEFVSAILDFAEAKYQPHHYRLTVATFNERAIRLYEKLGFRQTVAFPTQAAEFIVMERREG